MTEKAQKILKENGYKLTRPRLAVLEILTNSTKPLNPYEIAKEGNLDVVTVYRILDVFEKLHLVHFLKTQKKYSICEMPECASKKIHCHHQFTCKSCLNVSDLHLSDQNFLKNLIQKYPELEIDEHYFEFSGLCSNCK